MLCVDTETADRAASPQGWPAATAWVERDSGQASWLCIEVDGRTQVEGGRRWARWRRRRVELNSVARLGATPVPLTAPVLTLAGSNAFLTALLAAGVAYRDADACGSRASISRTSAGLKVGRFAPSSMATMRAVPRWKSRQFRGRGGTRLHAAVRFVGTALAVIVSSGRAGVDPAAPRRAVPPRALPLFWWDCVRKAGFVPPTSERALSAIDTPKSTCPNWTHDSSGRNP